MLSCLLVVLTWAGVDGAPGGRGGASLAAVGLLLRGRRRRRLPVAAAARALRAFATTIRPVAGASKVVVQPPRASRSALLTLSSGASTDDVPVHRARIGFALDPLAAMGVIVLASLAAAIPAAPGYVGTFDAGMLLGLHAAGVAGRRRGRRAAARALPVLRAGDARGLVVLIFGYGAGAQLAPQGEHGLEQVAEQDVGVEQREPVDQRSRT